MKLLILTQKIDINDDVLGFFHGWVREFAKHCESLTVICLQKGLSREISRSDNFSGRKIISREGYDLPENVKVLSLGKERVSKKFIKSKVYKVFYVFNFYKYIWKYRKEYDSVFVHMNQIYVILGGVFWRLWKKKIGLWYAHGAINFKISLAEKLAHFVFTSTQSGFRLKSKKKKVVGQGIDTNLFKKISLKKEEKFTILSVGRISIAKDYKTLILASEFLKNKRLDFQIKILGSPITKEDENYFKTIKKLVKEKDLEKQINFLGSVANKNLPYYLNQADVFVNMGKTGSLDKVILEAMANEVPVLTCNEAVLEIWGDYIHKLMYPKNDYKELAEKIEWVYNLSKEERMKVGKDLREIVVLKHNLENLIKRIVEEIRA